MNNNPPIRPTLRQLQYFVAVAERGAFGTAAEDLAVSQPALSKQLATMEAELDVVLFERTSRRVKLTSVGKDLLPRARSILQKVRDLQVAARGSSSPFGNRLALGVLPSIGAYFMPLANRRLHELYPELRLIVEEGSTEQLLEKLQSGSLDAVIGTPTNNPNFESAALFVETLWVCAAADDPISVRRGPVELDELADKPLLSLSTGFRLAEIVERLANLAGTYVSRDYRGASLDAVRQMAVMGAGVAVLPSLYALAEAVRDPNFAVRRIAHPEAAHPIVLLWRRASSLEGDCRHLADHLLSVKQKIRAARSKRFQ